MYFGAQRVAGEEAGLRVVAGLGADVDRHRREPKVSRPHGRALIEPALDEILAFCAEDPIERVFLEDVARRGLGRFTGARRGRAARRALPRRHEPRPLGQRLRRVRGGRRRPAGAARDRRGERGRRLLGGGRGRLPARRARTGPGQPVYVLEEPPEPGETGLRAGDAGRLRAARAGLRRGASRGARDRPARARPGELPLAHADADRGRAARGSGPRTARSCSRPRRRPGRRSAVQLQQVWVDPSVRGRGYAQRGMRDLCRLLLERVPAVCLFVRAENAPAIRVYESDRHAAHDLVSQPRVRLRKPRTGEARKAASAENVSVRRLGLTAAGLLVMVAIALALVTNGRARPNHLVHTCSSTDREFIEAARTNMTALELWSEQYQSGDALGATTWSARRRARRRSCAARARRTTRCSRPSAS